MERIGLVLGAGAVTGQAFEVGALEGLRLAGVLDGARADVIVGTSAGSTIGAVLRFGLDVRDCYAEATHGRKSRRGRALFAAMGEMPPVPQVSLAALARPRLPSLRAVAACKGVRARPLVVDLFTRNGRHETQPYAERLRRITGDRWPSKPLLITVARLPSARRVAIGGPGAPDCDVATAVAASCAIPGHFKPVEIDGVRYVDGGVHSPTNADLLAGRGLDVVYVISPMSSAPGDRRRSLASPARRYCHRVLRREVRALKREGTRVVVIEPCAETQRVIGVNMLDMERVPAVATSACETVLRRFERSEQDGEALQNAAASRREEA